MEPQMSDPTLERRSPHRSRCWNAARVQLVPDPKGLLAASQAIPPAFRKASA